MRRNELEYRHNLDRIDAERERRYQERVRQEYLTDESRQYPVKCKHEQPADQSGQQAD